MAYDDGKLTPTRYGDKMFYGLVDGRTLSVQLETGDLIKRLGVRKGQPFNVCKREVKGAGGKKTQRIDVWLPGPGELPPNVPSPASVATGIPDTDLEKELRATLAEIERRKLAGASVTAPAPVAAAIAPLQPPTHNGNGSSNGTNGVPRPYQSSGIPAPPVKIPMDVALREIAQFTMAELKAAGLHLEGGPIQDLISTFVIGGMREGWIGPWQRGGVR